MRTFIIHFKDDSSSTLQGSSLGEVLSGLERTSISWYEEPSAETAVQHKLEAEALTEEVSLIQRTIRVPSATPGYDPYDVVVFPTGEVWCPCIGFANRHYCWHSTYVKELLKEEENARGRKV